ncbi:hypothetical protein IMCC3088_2431 [Aequoribacter fuscus]|uniref:Uncharacterized protein n=1 Tax=Aequoribacter fuscus TaxID=2518989 RepID=F3L450_9GAMM|nr:hypothetical protein IMCC3088_2431 [Aequoribacter fuscus]
MWTLATASKQDSEYQPASAGFFFARQILVFETLQEHVLWGYKLTQVPWCESCACLNTSCAPALNSAY